MSNEVVMYSEIEGDLISLAKEGQFDVVAHGCNCFCTMGAGIAPQMAAAFGADKFTMEGPLYRGNFNKLGTIDYKKINNLIVVNAYTQYGFGNNHPGGTDIPLDYDALTLCMRKMNFLFKGKKIGLPQIGCGLAGGDWERVKEIIQTEFTDCDVTVVIYKPKTEVPQWVTDMDKEFLIPKLIEEAKKLNKNED